MQPGFTRSVDSRGVVALTSPSCRFEVVRPGPGIVVVTIAGHDRGEFGTAVFDELRDDLTRYPPLTVFLDISDAVGAIVTVQDHWSAWFADHRRALGAVHILTRGKYLHFTAEVVKLWSRTGDLIRVHSDSASFYDALRRAAPSYFSPPA
jgi:hypothetical protein